MKLDLFKPLFALLLIQTAVLADYRDDVGYRTLDDDHQLISKGANLRVGQVEAKIDLGFLPDILNGQFIGKQFLCSPPSISLVSPHATMVGSMFYGADTGLAPATPKICILDSDSFLGSRGLRVGQNMPPKAPAKLGVSVLNN